MLVLIPSRTPSDFAARCLLPRFFDLRRILRRVVPIRGMGDQGHRRYAETFSPYARQFLERLDRPRAERIEGVLPAVAVDRTAPARASRSTVGTMTSVADYLRALYARAATLHCRQCGEPVVRDTPSSIFDAVADAEGRTALVTFPHRVGATVAPEVVREAFDQHGGPLHRHPLALSARSGDALSDPPDVARHLRLRDPRTSVVVRGSNP